MSDFNIPVIDTAQMRKVDQLMIECYGISLVQMMENAGKNLALMAKRILDNRVNNRKICVVTGSGNNGGGGLVAARHLSNWGAEITVLVATPDARFKEVAALQLEIVRHLPVSVVFAGSNFNHINWQDCDLIIDAIFGYGLNRSLDSKVADIIEAVNAMPCPVLSLDTPSGLDTTNGIISDTVIQAHTTLTLALPKTGLLKESAKKYVGRLFITDISVPPLLYAQIGLGVINLFSSDTIIPYNS